MNIASKPKIVLLGMMTKMPVAGVVWQTLHYLIGFRRLGFDVYYVEEHARTPSMFMETEQSDGSANAAEFLSGMLTRFDFGDRWVFRALHDDSRCFGISETQLAELYRSAALVINLHGGTLPLPQHYQTGRLVYLETDPVALQIELHDNSRETIDFLAPHCAFFTFGENYGQPGCGLPFSDRFKFFPTRQPVVVDFWDSTGAGAGSRFTTIGNWQQNWRQVTFKGEVFYWSKHFEFLKFADLPRRTSQELELALSSYTDQDKAMLEAKGWRVRHGLDVSMDIDVYRDYIARSRGEFTVAKDQNVRLRSGWFSDRSITYLAAGRPVITQETGFCDVLPTGCGLFGFSTMDEILNAIDKINSAYDANCRAAREIACDYFNYDVVLGRLLDDLGVTARVPKAPALVNFPSPMILSPLSRRPIRLPESTVRVVTRKAAPAFAPRADASVPRASIVVVTFNNLVFTRMCLESVLANTEYPNFEIVVVDNGSTDGTPDYLRALAGRNPQVRVIFHPENRGFARANNAGLAAAAGDLLVLLNNDTLVAPGWLTRLAGHLEDRSIGVIGPVTNRIGNEAEVETNYRTYGRFLEFAAQRSGSGVDRLERQPADATSLFDIPMAAMFCLAMRRDAFEKIGPLDERFEMGMFEDDDYALRVRAAGLRCACAEDVFVHHFGEASLGALAAVGQYGALFAENRARFEKKWGVAWSGHRRRRNGAYGELTERIRRLARERLPAGARVLVVSKGDDELLRLDGCNACHFPSDPAGCYAGHHPADSDEAIARLEAARTLGAEFLLFPKTSFWWLDHYAGLTRHLETHARLAARDAAACALFDLRKP
jgi:GT2 family glycosyltransferase